MPSSACMQHRRRDRRLGSFGLFFFNVTATTEIYALSLHDALPISAGGAVVADREAEAVGEVLAAVVRVGDEARVDVGLRERRRRDAVHFDRAIARARG